MSNESKILTGILVAVVGGLIGLFVLANGGGDDTATPTPTGDKAKLIREDTYKQGAGAIQLVEYGDYQCPACAIAHPNIKQILKEYDGKVTLYFRHFPLTNIHRNAMAAAHAAEAAAAQGKYWEMHNKLYDDQKAWSDLNGTDAVDKFVEYAKALGLDTDKFRQAITHEQYKARIAQDIADGTAQNIQGTPSIFVNGKLLSKFDYPTIRDAVEAALKQQ